MMTIEPGAVVRKHDTDREMLVIGSADHDPNEVPATPEVSCAWEEKRVLHE
jgi:hypothetical protein